MRKIGLAVHSPSARSRKVIHSARKMSMTPRLARKVPNHMKKVKKPQTNRYQPTKAGGTLAEKNSTNSANDHQNEPKPQKAVKPNVLPRGISIRPAQNCAVPPNAKAIASTIGTEAPSNQPALCMLSSHVVRAKPERPRGAGLASFNGSLPRTPRSSRPQRTQRRA